MTICKPRTCCRGHAATHAFGMYDFETTHSLDRNVDAVVDAWKNRRRPAAFERIARRAQPT